jgi:PKD repeat protein
MDTLSIDIIMFAKYNTLLLLTALLCSCVDDDSSASESTSPTVDFEWTIRGDCSTPSVEVLFQSKSVTVGNSMWEFGDGTTSSETNPIKIYPKAGNYIVRLYTETNQVEKEIYVFRNSDGTAPQHHCFMSMARKTSAT